MISLPVSLLAPTGATEIAVGPEITLRLGASSTREFIALSANETSGQELSFTSAVASIFLQREPLLYNPLAQEPVDLVLFALPADLTAIAFVSPVNMEWQ